MKKIVFATLPLRGNLTKCLYPVAGNAMIEIHEPTYFAATSALAGTLKADDEVKVILLETEGGENAGKENAKLFEEELNRFNAAGAKISYEIFTSTFDPSKANLQHIYKTLLTVRNRWRFFCSQFFSLPKNFSTVLSGILFIPRWNSERTRLFRDRR